MDNNKNISEEERSFLPAEPGQNNFVTPPSYFDELPSAISNRIHSSKKEPFFLLKPSFAIGSLAVLSCIIALFVFLNKDISYENATLSENEIAHVVENPELYDIDGDAITEMYLTSNTIDEAISYGAVISEDEIKTFLEENSDATKIINEY